MCSGSLQSLQTFPAGALTFVCIAIGDSLFIVMFSKVLFRSFFLCDFAALRESLRDSLDPTSHYGTFPAKPQSRKEEVRKEIQGVLTFQRYSPRKFRAIGKCDPLGG